MNALDNERESRATDMLLNYETIKYFCAEKAELSGYDTATRKYQASTGPGLQGIRHNGCYPVDVRTV
jgi:ABC-type transport system involved in Fe-S cluster assembly fused permease/ATPase subunit